MSPLSWWAALELRWQIEVLGRCIELCLEAEQRFVAQGRFEMAARCADRAESLSLDAFQRAVSRASLVRSS